MSKSEMTAFVERAVPGDTLSLPCMEPLETRLFRAKLQYECLKAGKKTKTKIIGNELVVTCIK